MPCSDRYDDDWVTTARLWRRCQRCGLLDLAGSRVVRALATLLRR